MKIHSYTARGLRFESKPVLNKKSMGNVKKKETGPFTVGGDRHLKKIFLRERGRVPQLFFVRKGEYVNVLAS